MTLRNLALAFLLPAVAAAAPLPGPDAANVTTLRLAGREGRTELTVEVTGGEVRWNDFTLSGPPRLVVDIQGARNSLDDRYDGIDRGGVVGVRTSQRGPDQVRIVVDLQRDARYTVSRVPEGVRIALQTGAPEFQPWSSGGSPVAPAPVAAAPARRPAPAPLAPAAEPLRREARRMTASFEDTDMRDVLSSFAEFSGHSIIPGAEVGDIKVAGVEIKNQPWDVALKSLLQAYGLAAQEEASGIIRVDKMEKLVQRDKQEPLVTQPFQINYVPAAELVETFKDMKSERGSIVANAATNTLIVTDVDRVVRQVGQLIHQLDIPVRQVAIEGKIIFVDRTQLEALGIKYDLKDMQGSSFGSVVETPVRDPQTGEFTGEGEKTDRFLIGGRSIAAVGNAKSEIQNATLDVAVSLLLANRFSLVSLVSALQESRVADVQAMPQITTLDNKTARIFVGEEITFLTASASGGVGAGGGLPTNGVTLQPVKVDAGIELEVTPHITADRRVRLSLKAENSNPTTTSANLLNVSRQQASNEVLVGDGETVVIGGLTVTRVSDTRSGIPFLMDIPVLGGLFRSTNKEERKQDLLILITPHIVDAAPGGA